MSKGIIMRVAVVGVLLFGLSGCLVAGAAAIPIATQLTLGVTAAGLGVTAIHDCKVDGGAPGCLNPFEPAKSGK